MSKIKKKKKIITKRRLKKGYENIFIINSNSSILIVTGEYLDSLTREEAIEIASESMYELRKTMVADAIAKEDSYVDIVELPKPIKLVDGLSNSLDRINKTHNILDSIHKLDLKNHIKTYLS